ncbi:MAG: LytTR family DNA-binding domain-containing protein [Lentilitoribacter sp.]
MTEFANDTVFQLTLRQMQAQFTEPKFYGYIGVAVLILTLSGPFGTLEHYNFLERFAYWAILTPATYILASGVATYVTVALKRKNINDWFSYILGGSAAGVIVGMFVWLFGVFLEQSFSQSFAGLLKVMTFTMPITIGVTMLFKLSEKNDKNTSGEYSEENLADTRFFERIPKSLGRDLISLNSQDHYVKVTTSFGSDLILMRLSDAVVELKDHDGVQPHRSWWVSKNHIASIKVVAGKKMLELKNGDLIPVSRANLKNVTELLSH